jgi:light-regulated signal transduction histidine kinase (bacteriophytochrome)
LLFSLAGLLFLWSEPPAFNAMSSSSRLNVCFSHISLLACLWSQVLPPLPKVENSTLRAGAEAATVGVQDFGVGIAQEKQAQVFERFFRVSDPEHASFPGLGLGLYISAEIVKRHGGRIWVESSEGLGSTFFFTVPLAPVPAVGPAQQEGAEPHA